MAGVTVRPPRTVEEHQSGGTDHLQNAGHPAGRSAPRKMAKNVSTGNAAIDNLVNTADRGGFANA